MYRSKFKILFPIFVVAAIALNGCTNIATQSKSETFALKEQCVHYVDSEKKNEKLTFIDKASFNYEIISVFYSPKLNTCISHSKSTNTDPNYKKLIIDDYYTDLLSKEEIKSFSNYTNCVPGYSNVNDCKFTDYDLYDKEVDTFDKNIKS